MAVEPGEALAWYRQMLDQLHGNKSWSMVESDPASRGADVDRAMREHFGQAEGVVRDYQADPLGNMRDWREFLSERVRLN